MLFPDPELAGYVDVEGGRIWYRVNGADKPGAPLVGIAGGPGVSHHYLLPLVTHADTRPVILYDQLDIGNSDHPGDTRNWTVVRFTEELEHLRVALGYAAITPVGHSWGGTLATEYALSHPDRTAELILVSPLISTTVWTANAKSLVDALPAYLRHIISDCEARGDYDDPGYAHAMEEFYKRHVWRFDVKPPEFQRAFDLFNLDLYRYMWGPSEFTVTGTLTGYDRTGDLASLKMPTLVIGGEHDEARPETLKAIAAHIAGASHAEIKGASHLSFLEEREAFAAELRAFLKARS